MTRRDTHPETRESPRWTFLTNHSHVLLVLAEEPSLPLRIVAERVGITERSVQRIVTDLEADGYLKKRKTGRTNEYVLKTRTRLRHPVEEHCTVADLIEMVRDGSYKRRQNKL